MIDTIAIFGLIITIVFGKLNLYVMSELLNSLHCCILIFIICGRIFLTIAQDNSIKESKRLLIECTIYLIFNILLISNVLYFSSSYPRDPYWQIGCYSSLILCITLSKIYLFKNNIYGKRYLFWNIIDCILIAILFVLDFFISEFSLIKDIVLFEISMLMILLLFLVNRHISRSLEYWIHINAFIKTIDSIAKEKIVEIIMIPQSRDLNKDEIYKNCIFILKSSFIRILELYKLMMIVRKILLKNGYDKSCATLISAHFHANLQINLMNRDLDYSLLPSRLVNYIQKRKRRRPR